MALRKPTEAHMEPWRRMAAHLERIGGAYVTFFQLLMRKSGYQVLVLVPRWVPGLQVQAAGSLPLA